MENNTDQKTKKRSKLEIITESVLKDKQKLIEKEKKLKEITEKEQLNLLKKIAPTTLKTDVIVKIVSSPEKIEKLKENFEKTINSLITPGDTNE